MQKQLNMDTHLFVLFCTSLRIELNQRSVFYRFTNDAVSKMHLLLGALTTNLTSNNTLFPVTLFYLCPPLAPYHSFDWPEYDVLSPLPFL